MTGDAEGSFDGDFVVVVGEAVGLFEGALVGDFVGANKTRWRAE